MEEEQPNFFSYKSYKRFSMKADDAQEIAEEVLNHVKSCGQFWEIWNEMLPQTQERLRLEIAKIIKKRCNHLFRKSLEQRKNVKTHGDPLE